MRTPLKNILAFVCLLALGSCTEDIMRIAVEDDGAKLPIVLNAAYPSATRASDAGFEGDDKMGVFVLDYDGDVPQDMASDELHAYNVRFDFNESDNSWKGTTTLYWTSKETAADIIGYYPYLPSIEDAKSIVHVVQRRQDLSATETSMGGYESSDFLWGVAKKIMPTDSRIDLTFQHLMAGVRITLKEGYGFESGSWEGLEKSVLISNIKPSVNINLAEGSLSEASGDVVSVTPYQNGTDWRAVVVPQKVDGGCNVIDITIDGISYHLTKNEPIDYVGGKLNTFTITVDKRDDGNGYIFSISDEALTPWLDDADFRDGIMRNYIVIENSVRGFLKDTVEKSGHDKNAIGNLKIIGELDEQDFMFLRDEMPVLSKLNLKNVKAYSDDQEDYIPESALAGKKTLTHFVFPDNVKIIGNNAFANSGLVGDLIIPEGVTHIGTNQTAEFNGGGYGAFRNCQSLTGNLILPKSLRFIEAAAFLNTSLSGSLHLPQNLEYIGGGAFFSCGFYGELNLPENLNFIGEAAFDGNHFSGTLSIPSGIKVIYDRTFANAFQSGNLILHDGIKEIRYMAFGGCGFKGELKLPANLKTLGNCAFYETDYSSIIFPKGLSSIGSRCFENCKRLAGKIDLPSNITEINKGAFANCTLLEEVIIGENIKKIGSNAFGECYNLTSVVVNNPEPPLMSSSYDYEESRLPFYGVPMDNFTLQVPAESVELYSRADGWKEFKRIAAYSNFICRPSTACALTTSHQETLILNSDGDWEISHIPSWCSISRTSGNGKTELTLTIKEMTKGSGDRSDYIEFALKDTDFTTKCTVNQYDYEYGEDECITLQKATHGNGVDILFVGDGFDGEAISKGEYIDLVNRQMDAFFGVEPYTTYRDYFNVYACVSLSQETGVNTTNTWRNTRFSTLYAGGTLIHEDIDIVFDYAVDHSPLNQDKIEQSLIIMALNSDEYGGATTMTWNGAAVSICSNSSDPYPSDVRGIVQHEACGHAFGKLAEEKISINRYLNSAESQIIRDKQEFGWWQNISVSGKMSDVPWSHFIFDPRYSVAVDVYEGAFGVTRGVYRCELNSCMNYGIPYFNAISRQDIMKRILEYSGEGFTMEKFYETDSDKWGSTGITRAAMPDQGNAYVNSGLHHPVRIVKSKKY